jgi:hypothetical protein
MVGRARSRVKGAWRRAKSRHIGEPNTRLEVVPRVAQHLARGARARVRLDMRVMHKCANGNAVYPERGRTDYLCA